MVDFGLGLSNVVGGLLDRGRGRVGWDLVELVNLGQGMVEGCKVVSEVWHVELIAHGSF